MIDAKRGHRFAGENWLRHSRNLSRQNSFSLTSHLTFESVWFEERQAGGTDQIDRQERCRRAGGVKGEGQTDRPDGRGGHAITRNKKIIVLTSQASQSDLWSAITRLLTCKFEPDEYQVSR